MVEGVSEREVEERWDVPRSTLRNSIRGGQDRHIAHQHEQLLTPTQEAGVVGMCKDMHARFLPVRLPLLRAYAEAILQEQAGPDAHVTVGEHWADRFQKRHPELHVMTSKAIDEKRAMAKNPANIMELYVLGWQLGLIGNEKVVIYLRNPDDFRFDGSGALKQLRLYASELVALGTADPTKQAPVKRLQ
ncbi:hypothetical protein FRC09_004268 [Ceratobasidium sp. 395]|nr:hypothetical protein FRC09_004268 [Ceratobasidium sp. 395]